MNNSSTPTTKVDLQERAIRGVSWTLVHTVVSLPLAFVANLVTARVLGVSDYGRLAFLMTFMDVAGGIVSLGLGIGLLQFGARAHAAGRFAEVQHLLSVSQGFRLLVVAPLLSVAVVLVAHVELQILVVALLFGIWIPAALDGALFCVTIEGRSDLGAKVAILRNVLTQAAVISAALIFATADAAWSCRLMADGLMMFVYIACISPRYRRAVLQARWPRGFPSGFWRFALPSGFAAVVGTLALSRTEVFFLSWLSTPESVGIFALAFGLATHVFAPADALVGPLVPAVSGLNEVDSEALAPAFERVLRASATASGLACSAVLPALALLVPFLYGPEFKSAAPMLLVLGMAAAMLVIGGPVSVFTLGRLSGSLLVSANLVALAVDVALALCLIPVWGAWGAVAANAAGALTRLSILAVSELRALGLRGRAVGSHVIPAVAAIPIAFGVYFALDHVDAPPVLRSLLAALVGLALLTLTLKIARSGLTSGDRIVIARAVPSLVRGMVRVGLWMVVGRADDAVEPRARTSG